MTTTGNDVRGLAGWFPPSQEQLERWLTEHVERVDGRGSTELRPSVAAFSELIDSDPVVGMLVRRMVEQVPQGRSYTQRHVRDVDHLLALIDGVLDIAPEYGTENVTLPMGAVLDWSMGTPAGYAAYRDSRINAALKAILREWCEFLNTPASLYVLNDSPRGWKSDKAVADVGMEQYQHDPDGEHWGFTSWNDFFTRRLVDGARPVASPDDDAVIVSACESTPFGLRTDVQLHDQFWLKGQPYSLHDLLDNDEAAPQFAGGTVYQAFLSATNYHRWHSPVAGTIVRGWVVDGTYFSEADSLGEDDTESPDSQAYLAHVATRAIVLIQADNPAIGLMAFVAVGMSDVSSCIIGVEPGQHVGKGDELGYFQFGGSTHCLVFRPGAVETVHVQTIPLPSDPDAPLVLLHSAIATAVRS
ncbi:MAG: phosphatidylserine decarboxylase family protein [Mycobacteriaceae bacterium]